MKLRLGIVGCGQIVQTLHVPSIQLQRDLEVTCIVDPSPRNLHLVGRAFPKAVRASDIQEMGEVDAVLIATPSALHHQQTRYALERGWHVLVEKPAATTLQQARELAQLAAEKRLRICVNLNRRYLPNVQALRAAMKQGAFGKVRRVKVTDGARFAGTAEGGASHLSDASLSGSGVLLDTGSHMVDLALHLLGDVEPEVVSYQDDSHTRLEAECRFHLLAEASGSPIEINGFLSRISAAAQRVEVEMEGATLRVGLAPATPVEVTLQSGPELRLQIPVQTGNSPVADAFIALMADFLRGCREPEHRSLADLGTNLSTIRVIEACYAKRVALRPPWDPELPERIARNRGTPGARPVVAVIGAGGFLGARLFERLLAGGERDPRAIVHSSLGSFAVLRYIESPRIGSAADEAFLREALAGCDAVVNTAINMRGSRKFAIGATRQIARTVARVSNDVGVRRLIHISTVAVHGSYLGRAGQSLELDPARSTYAVAKHRSELDVLEECRRGRTEAVILRMGHIYGPYALGWTAAQREFVRQGKLVQVEGWRNPSNTIFVDNAVDGIMAAIDKAGVAGRTFYLTNWPNQSWAEFYAPLFELERRTIGKVPELSWAEFERILSSHRRSLPHQARSLAADILRPAVSRENLKAIKATMPYQRLFDLIETAMPIHAFEALKRYARDRAPSSATAAPVLSCPFDWVCCYASSAVLPVADAVSELGYSPATDATIAAKRTNQWLSFID